MKSNTNWNQGRRRRDAKTAIRPGHRGSADRLGETGFSGTGGKGSRATRKSPQARKFVSSTNATIEKATLSPEQWAGLQGMAEIVRRPSDRCWSRANPAPKSRAPPLVVAPGRPTGWALPASSGVGPRSPLHNLSLPHRGARPMMTRCVPRPPGPSPLTPACRWVERVRPPRPRSPGGTTTPRRRQPRPHVRPERRRDHRLLRPEPVGRLLHPDRSQLQGRRRRPDQDRRRRRDGHGRLPAQHGRLARLDVRPGGQVTVGSVPTNFGARAVAEQGNGEHPDRRLESGIPGELDHHTKRGRQPGHLLRQQRYGHPVLSRRPA